MTPDLQPGLQAALGDAFRLERELVRGGMSRPFLATEASLNRQAVAKVLPPEFTSAVSSDGITYEQEAFRGAEPVMRKHHMAGEPLYSLAVAGLVGLLLTAGTVRSIPAPTSSAPSASTAAPGLWRVYDQSLKGAKYIDLTHALTPSIPLWKGFAPPTFGPTLNPETGKPYQYSKDGFEATHYNLTTDQFGTQLDPPAHWAPEYPAIDELPATYAVRPLVVISIVDQVARNPGYHLQVADIERWERRNGTIPTGSVVMIRSDWSKAWPDPRLATRPVFPGVSLDALKFLHRQRRILFHGHEPLDTDTTSSLEGEYWLMHNGYAQAEGVANLSQVPETGCLVTIGYPKFAGGLGGYARYIAICPADWKHGVSVGELPEAPLPKSNKVLQWDTTLGVRIRR